MSTEIAFWSGEAEEDGFDPVKYPEIKPYIARPHRDDELGLRHLLEWPEAFGDAGEARPRGHRRRRTRSPRRRSFAPSRKHGKEGA